MIHRFVDLPPSPSVGIGFPCFGVTSGGLSYLALLPYDGSGVAADGTTEQLSTASANFTFTPMMDENSRKIVWKDAGSVWIIGEDGSGETELYDGSDGFSYSPWWHPDGSKILYMVARADGTPASADEIRTIKPDGTGETVVLASTGTSSTEWFGPASYNCDGTRIGFCQLTSSITIAMKTMDADGSNVRTIATMPTQFSGIRKDSPIWAWFTDDPDRLVIANTNTLASPVTKAMDYDGSNQVTLDSGTTRILPGHFCVMSGDTHYVTKISSGAKLVKVALDGSGATDLLTTTKNANQNVFSDATPGAKGRIYFDATGFPQGNDVWSCLPDGTGERNETSTSTRSYNLTS